MLPEAVVSFTKKHCSFAFAVCAILFAVGLQVWPTHNSPLTSFSLPFNTPHFIGRKNEVQNISQLLSFCGPTGSNEKNPNMVNIVGAPGFGKSTLAIAVGNELLKRGIDVHYVDLSGVNLSQDATATILATVTNKLEVINDKNHFRWARSVYRKTLLILDNCDELMTDYVRNVFLKSLTDMLSMSHSLRLLTTARYDYTVLKVMGVSFAVEPLSAESATQLLLNISPHTNLSAASSLANLTGRAALAIKIVGALLKEGELEDQLVNELAMRPIETLSPTEFQPEDQMRLVIASSFRRLSKPLTRCIATFAQIPGSFDKIAAAAVLNLNTSEARKKCLKPITKRCLLEFNDNVKRYHMHKLIKSFVKEELGARSNRQFVRYRLLNHYFKRLVDLAQKYDHNPREVLRSYDYDQHNFYHVLVYLLDPNFVVAASDVVRQSVVTLSEQAANLFLVRLPAGQLFRWYRAAREYATRLLVSDENNTKYCNIMLLLVRAATKEANRNSKITAILGEDRRLMVHCSINIKLKMIERVCLSPYEHTDIPDSVLDCYSTHAPILDLPVFSNFQFWNLGYLFHHYNVEYAAYLCFVKAGMHFGELDKRVKMTYLQSAIDVFERNNYHNTKPIMLDLLAELNEEERASSSQSHTMFIALGSAYVRLSNYESAIPPLLHAYEMIKYLFKENSAEMFSVVRLLGQAYFEVQRYEDAAKFGNISLLISKDLYGTDHWQTALRHWELAEALHKLGVDEALIHLMEAARLYETFANGDSQLFKIYLQIGNFQAAHFCPFSGAEYFYKAYRILYKTNRTKTQPATVSSTSTRNLQTSHSSVVIWATVVTNLCEFVAKLLPEDDQSSRFYGSLVGCFLYYFIVCSFYLFCIFAIVKIVLMFIAGCLYVRNLIAANFRNFYCN